MKNFEGVFTALATPFKAGSIDIKSYQKLVRFQLENDVRGLVVNGTTGESPTLEWDEVVSLYKAAREAAGENTPILIGTGSNNTEKTIKTSLKAQAIGADGVLVVCPYYNKPPQRGLVAHFKAVASELDIPLVLYNVPGRTAVSLGAAATAELSRVANIIGIKDATADMELGKQIIESCGPEFLVISGDDFTFHELAMMGGRGVISVLSNIAPKQTAKILDLAIKKNLACRDQIKKLQKLTELLFIEANPIPVKSALHLMGIIDSDEMRLPLVSLDEKYKHEVLSELKHLELIK